MSSIFYRQRYSNLWITLRADESLGDISSNYLEDFNGTPGQVSLRHMETGKRYYVPMNEVASDTTDTPHDVFKGIVSLVNVPDGKFNLEARVRDELGNYTILSAVAAPYGNERVIPVTIEIKTGAPQVIVFDSTLVLLQGGNTLDMSLLAESGFTTELQTSATMDMSFGSIPLEFTLAKN